MRKEFFVGIEDPALTSSSAAKERKKEVSV
jgi:hypothetical protein